MTWASGACLPTRSTIPRLALAAARWWWQVSLGCVMLSRVLGLAFLGLALGALALASMWAGIWLTARQAAA